MSEIQGNGFPFSATTDAPASVPDGVHTTDTLTAQPTPAGPRRAPLADAKSPSHQHSALNNFRMDRPWGRVLAGRIDELTRGGRYQAELLVTALWVAHRAARRLRRKLILQRKAARGEASIHACPDCGDEKGSDFCPFCHALEILARLVRPEQNGLASWELGRSADELAWVLPWFDARRSIDSMEAQFAGWLRSEAKAEADPLPPPKG